MLCTFCQTIRPQVRTTNHLHSKPCHNFSTGILAKSRAPNRDPPDSEIQSRLRTANPANVPHFRDEPDCYERNSQVSRSVVGSDPAIGAGVPYLAAAIAVLAIPPVRSTTVELTQCGSDRVQFGCADEEVVVIRQNAPGTERGCFLAFTEDSGFALRQTLVTFPDDWRMLEPRGCD
jgi:hypothetical protein